MKKRGLSSRQSRAPDNEMSDQPPRCCFGTDGELSCIMTLFRRPRFVVFTNALLALLMIMLAGRSEANCYPVVPDTAASSHMMENCPDMDADPADPAQPHHSDGKQAGICHLGCSVLLTAASAKHGHAQIYLPTYLPELAPLMVGISDIPQIPPPRFG